ncbi:AraC family transcriptional regulator [Vibrio sp. H11]|uniref:helix-turn-helix domain-containing protein n=1 Tax=Vibrio sp. H11 TaxID=2565928 RepID=UPI0010A5CCB4|nr:AraC family transcriptional regulator [Vibrio sp. H11]
MIAIPLPFVVSMLLMLLAVILWCKPENDSKPASGFSALCAVTTAVVGMRWSLDLTLLRLLQPILASLVPMTAWYCFQRAHQTGRLSLLHWSGPMCITFAVFSYPYWHAPLDLMLTLLYIGYGIRLLYSSRAEAQQVRVSDLDKVRYAEQLAGCMLLFSACIDGALSIDFSFNSGRYAMYILAIGYSVLLPLLALSVIQVSRSTLSDELNSRSQAETAPVATVKTTSAMATSDAQAIVLKLDDLMHTQQAYLDPDLTLDRLARKLTIPAKQISAAVNQIHGRNISKLLNEYRIEHAKQYLVNSDESITQVYLRSGFQTKSNFNREFSRVTGQTPSAYRRTMQAE